MSILNPTEAEYRYMIYTAINAIQASLAGLDTDNKGLKSVYSRLHLYSIAWDAQDEANYNALTRKPPSA